MTRKIPESAIELIKRKEGFKAKKYKCPAGYWTIGFGHKIQEGEIFKEPMTPQFADNLMRTEAQYFADGVDRLVKVHLTDNQFTALLSFVYNFGLGQFKTSTLLKKLNDGKYLSAANELDRWVYADGKRSDGLIERRKEEKELFLSGVKEMEGSV